MDLQIFVALCALLGLRRGVAAARLLPGPAAEGAALAALAAAVLCVPDAAPHPYFSFTQCHRRPREPRCGEVYNIGGGRHSNCSMLEAIHTAQRLAGKKLSYSLSDDARSGDHIWWISDVRKFQTHYPNWQYAYDMERILEEIVAATQEKEDA